MKNKLRCFVGILLTVSLPLFAQTYSGGSGTEADPYQIANKADLLYLGNQTRHYDKYFIMTADIDLVGEFFTSAIIGEDTRAGGYFYGKKFLGNFNGNGHVIRNLSISGRNNYGFLGLFGNIGTEGSVTKLGVENVSIRGNGIDGWKVGAICGSNSGTISECYSTGDVSVQRSHVGGICGYNDGGTIINCYSSVKVVGGGWLGGGLCGYALKGNIENCYSTGWVSPTGGGLISTSIPDNPAIITGCFWDVNTSEKTSSGGGVGKTTAEMQSILTFWETGWDLANIWQMNGYPSLRCFNSHVPGVSIATIFITGASVIDENTSENYICTAVYSDGSSANVSASVTWSEDSAFANIDTAGLLTAQSVDSDQDLAVSASYTFRGVTKTSTLNVKIWNFVPSVSISGPLEMNEESSTNYTCTAVYTYGSSVDVTRQAVWSDDSDYVEISTNGLLTALSVVFDEEVTLSVSYTSGGVTETDTHTVLIKNIPYSGGSGTEEDPYLISTKADLLYLGVLTAHYNKHFILTDDIDLGDEVFRNALIAPADYNSTSIPFSGIFDGNGHVISNLKIDLSGLDSGCIGLFGRISGAQSGVKNLHLEKVKIFNGYSNRPRELVAGAVCGYLNGGRITNCRASGSIGIQGSAGGICGYNSRGYISGCVANVSVKGTSEVGGFCGGSYYAEFDFCASYGAVCGSECVGGFIGSTVNNEIEKCFALGDVEGHYSVGGFSGDIHFGRFTDCYSAGRIYGNSEVGGFIGYSPDDDFSVNSCFWDIQNSGIEISVGNAYGITTAQMQDQFTFDEEGWDFYHDWEMDIYPVLQSICEEMTLSSISVSAPSLVKENSVANLKCYASFRDGRVLNVTPSALWSDNSDFVEVDTNGVAYIAEVSSDQSAVITAVYEYNGIVLTNAFELSVKDIDEGALFCGGSGSEGDPWLIGTPDDLIALSTNASYYIDHFLMISDIDLDGLIFDRALIAPNENTYPGYGDFSAVEFNGVFDGGGHVIRSLRIGTAEYGGGFIGFFGCVGENGIVTSTVISNAAIGGESLPHATGILCGENRGHIRYCLVNGVVRHDQGSYRPMNFAGGVCGVNKGVFAACSVDVVFDLLESGYHYIGGFVGSTEGVITNSHAVAEFNYVEEGSEMGGFCGGVYHGSVHSCSATMHAVCVYSRNVGAFVGENYRGSVLFSSAESDLVCGEYCNDVAGFCGANGGLVDGCLSSGIIYGSQNEYMGIGGFCGHNNGDIKRSMSSCDIVADEVIAGVAGFCGSIYDGSIENCFCAGHISSPIGVESASGFLSSSQIGRVYNCYSATEIISGGYYSECSGFCRSATSSTITNCFWDIEKAGISHSSGGVGKTTAEMQMEPTFTDAGWDFVGETENGEDDIWYMSGYPQLAYFNPSVTYRNLTVENGTGGGYVKIGTLVPISADLPPAGYIFDEWVVDPESFFSNLQDSSLPVTTFAVPSTNVTLTAQYRILTYDVTFQLDDRGVWKGGGPLVQIVEHGSAAVVPATQDNIGWRFIDWDVEFDNIISNTFVRALYQATVAGVEVFGPAYVNEISSGVFTCIATYGDGSTMDVTSEAVWSLQSALPSVSIVEGLLSVASITSNFQVTVVARYEADNGLFVDDTIVDIINFPYSSGSGTGVEPYKIATKKDLLQLAATTTHYNKHFLLINDIDLAGTIFTRAVIAPSSSSFYNGTKFTGAFDGGGYALRNLTINTAGAGNDYLALFGYLDSGATVVNLSVVDAVIIGQPGGSNNIGGICAYNKDSVVSNCYVSLTASGDDYIGGLCGQGNGGRLECSYAEGSVSGDDYIGGLCAKDTDGTIRNCYSAVTVKGDDYVGGLLAYSYRSTVTSSYSAGAVTGDKSSGGLLGRVNVSTVNSSFWDTTTSHYATSAAGTGRTTAEMQMPATFTAKGWDFTNIWYMNDYPALRCFNPPGTYSHWVMNNPAIPVGLRAESDTPAGDAIPNLLKYACGLPAMEACTTADLMTIDSSTPSVFSVLYYKSKSAQDVTLRPLWAASMHGPWSTLGLSTELIGTDAEREQWKASIPLGASGFIRLRAAQ